MFDFRCVRVFCCLHHILYIYTAHKIRAEHRIDFKRENGSALYTFKIISVCVCLSLSPYLFLSL